ncbi:MAG TPA: RodZ domain-containing protein [Gaiellaceae bacterium]|nr:RodZ domain-containing protein [Gaiellaceae bacterium]
MFEIGSSLRQARQRRGLGLADVEHATHIRVRYLGALEDERFDLLPGPAYVRGFLRTYAEFLGLDGTLLVDEFNEHFAPPEEELQPIRPQRLPGRGSGAVRRAAAVVVALGAATAVVWQLGFASPSPQHASTSGLEPPTRTVPRHEKAPAAPRTAPVEHAPATLVVHATRGDCWVEVRIGSADGRAVSERTLGEGGTLRFGLARKLWVRLGAPGNVDVTVRGKAVELARGEPVNLTAA